MGHPIAILGVGTEQAGGIGHCRSAHPGVNIGSGNPPGCFGLSDGSSSIVRVRSSGFPDKAGTRTRAAACAIDRGAGEAGNWLLLP